MIRSERKSKFPSWIGWGSGLLLAVFSTNLVAQETADDLIPEIKILMRMDLNHDGVLALSEIPPEAKSFIKNLVENAAAAEAINENGHADLAVLIDCVQSNWANRKPAKLEPRKPASNRECIKYAMQLVSLYDVDKNQVLTANEFHRLSDQWIECDLSADLALDAVEVGYGIKCALNFPRNASGGFDEAMADKDIGPLKDAYQKLLSESSFQPKTTAEEFEKQLGDSRTNAQSLVNNYDANQNGTLEANELDKIGPSWREADFDRNSVATVDEIQVRFQEYERQARAEQLNGTAPNANQAASAAKSLDSTNKLTQPTDLSSDQPNQKIELTGLLPLDADQNGQIEMHEFADDFDLQMVEQFYRRDFNHDGVITREEWNRFQAENNRERNKDLPTAGK